MRFGRLSAAESCLISADRPLSWDDEAERRPWGCAICPEEWREPIGCPDTQEDVREAKGCLGCPDAGREPVGCPEDRCKPNLLFPDPVSRDVPLSDFCFLAGGPSW